MSKNNINIDIYSIVIDENEIINISTKTSIFKTEYFNISCLGRFVEEKNHELLIRSFSNIADDNYFLHIYGEGPLKNKYENIIISHGN